MKKALIFLFFIPFLACAENVSLSFKAIPVIDLAEATYKSILGRDYMISPELIGMDKRVTISVKSIDKEKLPLLLSDVLATVGVRARDSGGIVRLETVAATQQPLEPLQPLAAPGPFLTPPGGPVDPMAAPREALEPQDYDVYRPNNRTAEFLQAALRAAGGGLLPGGNSQGSQTAQDFVIVYGTEEKRAKVMKLLQIIDQRPVAMNVRAALIEFTESKDNSYSLGAILDIFGSKLQLSLGAGIVATDNYARLKTGSIDAVLKAIDGDNRFRFRTQPSLRLMDGETGRLMVGSEVPTRGDLVVSKDALPIQSIVYRSSGVVLTVKPRALNGRVVANIVQEVSTFAPTQTSNIDSPTLNKRQIEATIDAEDNEVVVLAGLDEMSATEGRSGLPWLPFNTSRTSTNRSTQLLVLLEFKRL